MALPSCTRCGTRDPQRMHGLMSLWFGPLVELEADLGYFYLCPACHDELVVPELERIQNRILELHPAHRVTGYTEDTEDTEGTEAGREEEGPAGPGGGGPGEEGETAQLEGGSGDPEGAADQEARPEPDAVDGGG